MSKSKSKIGNKTKYLQYLRGIVVNILNKVVFLLHFLDLRLKAQRIPCV